MTIQAVRGSRIAAVSRPSPTDLLQLHAEAENALSVALFHLQLPVSNIPGATRKAVQALGALHKLHSLASNEGRVS
jgi:hypothetical protein